MTELTAASNLAGCQNNSNLEFLCRFTLDKCPHTFACWQMSCSGCVQNSPPWNTQPPRLYLKASLCSAVSSLFIVAEKCCQPASGGCRDVHSELPSLCLWDFKGFLCFLNSLFLPQSSVEAGAVPVPLQLPAGENPAFLVFLRLSGEAAHI